VNLGSTTTSRAPSERPDLLAPEELAALGGLELQARAVVEGFLMGLHRSPHRGFSAEFAELRAYRPGDDLRHIDWRMYARSDRFYVKQFEEETNLRAYLLVDASASMEWSSRPGELPSKLWYGKVLSAAIGLLLLRQGDRAGLAVFDDGLRSWIPSRGGQRQWLELIRRLRPLEAAGTTDPSPALRETALRLRRRGLVILISDLLLDRGETLRSLSYLRHRGHQVLVFHLLDPGERELAGAGQVRFRDPETGDELRVDVTEVRREYREAVDRAVKEWRAELRSAGMEYVLLDTSRPLTTSLRAFLEKRGRLG
jgi:uncharacterized protein (DUF58 family)